MAKKPSADPVAAYIANQEREAYTVALAEPDGLVFQGLERIDAASKLIWQAFNVEEDPAVPYTFPRDVRVRAGKLVLELFDLWSDNKGRMQLRAGAFAGQDQVFQRFMSTSMRDAAGRRGARGTGGGKS